jgi:thiol-disulfide isomerase/thioredoxin
MDICKKLGLTLLLFLGHSGFAQQIQVVKYPDLERLLSAGGDSILVVNFWATWCAPCVKELPYFEKLQASLAGGKVKVVLVSLDYLSVLQSKVKPFVARTGIRRSKVLLLDEPDPNQWMDKVDANWSGALPFTMFIQPGKAKKGYERPFTAAELEAEFQTFIR